MNQDHLVQDQGSLIRLMITTEKVKGSRKSDKTDDNNRKSKEDSRESE